MVKVTNDLLMATESGSPSLPLDLSALLTLLTTTSSCGIREHTSVSGTALNWFSSYLSNRKQSIPIGASRSVESTVTCDIPQESVLHPILFLIYMLLLSQILRVYNINFHCCTDDTQVYIYINPDTISALAKLASCLDDIRAWMKENC